MKAFVLDSKAGDCIAQALGECALEKNIKLEIKLSVNNLFKIPRDYEIYFIHLKDLINRSDLLNLKKEQPKSYFVEIGIGGGYYVGEELVTFDYSDTIFSYSDIEKILMESLTKNNTNL